MKFGVYVGRFNPIHKGHQAVIDKMLAEHSEKASLVIIGSSNAPVSLRHFFSYRERSDFIKKLYPNLKLIGLPDFGDDHEWLNALDDTLRAVDFNPTDVEFFGGCVEDIRFFADDGRKYKVLNRFDGTTPKISATEIRDALIFDRPLAGYLDEKIKDDIKELFKEKWERFKRM
ncbi:MAG: adenylyltransferase/cytidyltransferase family protein [Candidatus Paceibacterota bacterium]|jgi:cytidyltransferase-like protein